MQHAPLPNTPRGDEDASEVRAQGMNIPRKYMGVGEIDRTSDFYVVLLNNNSERETNIDQHRPTIY